MNSAPHLRLEDRPEFERVLDEALRTMARAETETAPPLATADLRTLAVADADAIAAHASEEYGEFVRVRERLRQPAGTAAPPSGTSPGGASSDRTDPSGSAGGSPPGPADSPADSSGAGAFVVLSLLLPVLSGSAAVIFLLVGYALGVVSPEPALAVAMRNVGWVFAVITVATGLVGAVSLLLSASRNAPTARRGSDSGRNDGPSDEITVARAAWRHALLQRGILPFLRDAQERAAQGQEGYRTPGPRLAEDDHRTPRLGYSGPDFSAHKAGAAQESTVERNRFSSPKYGSSRFSSPKYSTDGPTSGEYEGADSGEGSDSGSKSSGGRFYSPSYQSGSTDSPAEGRKFSSPGFKSGSTDSPAEGRRFSSPKYQSGSTDSPAEGRRFSSPKYQSGSTDSPAEGRKFSSPGFKSGSTDNTAEGRKFSSPKYQSGSTDSPAEGRKFSSPGFKSGATDNTAEGRKFSSPKYQSGSTDSPAEGRKFSSPGFKSGATGRDRAEDTRDQRDDEDPGPVPDGDDARSR
ncbi:hypothetical protein MTQ01_01225 [Streptomyces sp. XM4193]|uniref:hypothetical protein n=1 Tax=Streptomyces sp. XM4193 TaxID=2929782 RepID=UPI001FF7D878|nr:hypothetical protein [Streptomyces sp. XM4193]MCK1794669.1 hypothetical protein [Streptomyces sp. XM4193]